MEGRGYLGSWKEGDTWGHGRKGIPGVMEGRGYLGPWKEGRCLIGMVCNEKHL